MKGASLHFLENAAANFRMDDNNFNTEFPQTDGTEEMKRLKDPPPKKGKKKKKKHSLPFRIFKKLIAVIATTLLSLFLVMIITGTIVATALTVYVLDFMDDSSSITFQTLESGSDTFFYGTEIDENGEEKIVQLHRVKSTVQRIPVSIDKIPQHVRDAFVYTEDERFYVHDGVDYKRTFSAFLNMFLHFYDTNQGGSTITQQLIKNLTGDDEQSPQRKIREIFAAMQLEKTYSKDQILEEYLNYISFGGAVNGIELACINYFGKTVDQISIPEAAVLASIPKDPEKYGPMQYYHEDELNLKSPLTSDGRANNTVRQKYVLYKLYENGAITYDEYQEYLNTPIIYTDSEEYLKAHPEDAVEQLKEEQEAYSWALDAIYFEAIDFFMKEMNIDFDTALKRINTGGYKIYSYIDNDMQNYVEEKFLNLDNFLSSESVRQWVDINGDGEITDDESLPHVAFVALNYDGSIKATVGNWGEKTHSLVTNYAVRDKRSIGSTIKPISTYGLALETDHIHWGSVYTDKKVMDVNGKPWPTNYSTGGDISISGQTNFIYYFLQKSYNTVPAQLCQELTPQAVYKFCTEQLGLDLDPMDGEVLPPLSVGSLTYGITLQDMVNAYLPYGNEGNFCEAHIITKIENSNGDVIYQNDGNKRQAVSDQTAWVMNRLLKNVVDNGTGTGAKLNNKVVCGKTGTNENWWDLTFVGLTRDFVSGVTIGYKEYRDDMQLPSYIHSAEVWKNIIGEYADTHFTNTPADFDPVRGVIESPWCTATGKIAGQGCPRSSQMGYWKESNAPYCDGGHYVAPQEPVYTNPDNNSQTGGSDVGGNTGGGDVSGGNTGGGDVGGGNTGGDVGGGNTGGDVGGGNTGGDVGGGNTGGGDVGGGNTGGDVGGDQTW